MAHASVNIYGPQGCGKSHHARRIMQHYGLANLVDEGLHGVIKRTLREDVLYITVDPLPPALLKGVALVPFEDIARQLDLKRPS